MTDLPTRLLQSPKVGLGVTTAALVALATGGTSLLVSHGTRDLQPSAPVVAAPQVPGVPRTPVVVDHAPGSIALPPAHLVVRPRVVPPVPRPVPAVAPPVVAPVQPPVVAPPAVQPPVVQPPVVQPPVAPPPVLGPSVTPRRGGHVHPDHPDDNGKHLGQLKH